jgi:hypothetical protein
MKGTRKQTGLKEKVRKKPKLLRKEMQYLEEIKESKRTITYKRDEAEK